MVLDEQHAQTLRAQEDLIARVTAPITALTAPITALTATIEWLLDVMPAPQRSPTLSPVPSIQREPPPIPPGKPPVTPYRSPRHLPTPPPAPPACETIAFTFTAAETAASALGRSSSGIKLPPFHGKDGENVIAWLHQAERFFKLKNTADNHKVDLISFSLEDDAKSFFYYCFIRNNEVELTWDEFKYVFHQKYEAPRMRATFLRDKLEALRYRGPQHMPDFCEKFRQIESQIYDMAFPDRLNYFLKKLQPLEAAMHIQNQESLRSEDMEVVYQLARPWAINSRLLKHQDHSHHRSGKPLLKFGKKSTGDSLSTPASTTAKDSNDELDIIVPEQLNKMDLMATECFKYGKRGQFARDCKSPRPADKRVNFGKSSYGKSIFGKWILYQTVKDLSDDDESDYGILNPSDSEEAFEVLNLMSTYEFNHDKTSVIVNNSIKSTKLPVYDLVLNEEQSGKSVIDCGATTLYLNETTAKNMGLEISKIKPRKVKVADKDIVVIDSYCTFEAKIGDLPKETITAYTFPLGSIDLILGLPWLQKHNPHTDWRKFTFEFNRNGRRYMLWPAKPVPDIRIASLEEFASFVDKDTSYFLIVPPKLHTSQFSEKLCSLQVSKNSRDSKHSKPSENGKKKSTSVQPASEEPKLPRKLTRWIKRKCPDLLHEIGCSANLKPFDIDTGDAKPINIRPRAHSPADLEKIKKFIDENLKNNVISESKLPWSFPLVLAQKPNGGTIAIIYNHKIMGGRGKVSYPPWKHLFMLIPMNYFLFR